MLSRHIDSRCSLVFPLENVSVGNVKVMKVDKTDLLQLLDQQRGVPRVVALVVGGVASWGIRQHPCSDRPNHTERKHVLTLDTRLSPDAANKTAAIRDTLNDIVFQRCHESEQEFAAAVERIEKEKTAKTNNLLSVLGCGAIDSPVNDKVDFMSLMKCSKQLKEWAGKTNSTVVNDIKVNSFTHNGMFAKAQGKGERRPCWVHDGRRLVRRVLQRCCDGTRDKLLRPKPLCVLVRVARAVRDAAAVLFEKKRERRDLPWPFLNRTGFGHLRLGLAVPFLCLGLSVQGHVRSVFASRCPRRSKVFKKRRP